MIDLGTYISRPATASGGARPAPSRRRWSTRCSTRSTAIGPVRAFCGLTWNERLSGDLPELELTVLSYGGLGELRELSRHGLLDVVPCHYSAIPRMFASGRLPSDVGLLQVSPPDEDGIVLARHRRRVRRRRAAPHPHPHRRDQPAHARSQWAAPRIPLGRFAAVDRDRPAAARGADRAAGRPSSGVSPRHVAELIDDGDTLQIGVGSLPAAVLDALAGHQDLGFHTGMITDGVLRWSRRVSSPAPARRSTRADRRPAPRSVPPSCTTGFAELPVEFRPASYTHSPAGSLAAALAGVDQLGDRGRPAAARSGPRSAAASTSVRSADRSTSAGPRRSPAPGRSSRCAPNRAASRRSTPALRRRRGHHRARRCRRGRDRARCRAC